MKMVKSILKDRFTQTTWTGETDTCHLTEARYNKCKLATANHKEKTYFPKNKSISDKRRLLMTSEVLCGILIPFLGTSAGAACVFFMKIELSANVQRALSGFAAGFTVMMALDVALG